MEQQTSREYVAAMQAKIHEVLGPLIGEAPMAIVDFPDIRNVGDSAIWLGEIAYLKQHHRKSPDYVSKIEDFSDRQLERKVPDGPIFIHGGGNFGDIWVSHQNFRERILKRWPNRLVVQFPQSIHYDSDARADESARVIAQHKNFVLLVRDEESQHFARKRFDCEVRLCPDMAFCIGTLDTMPSPSMPLLAMLREDKEKVASRDGTAELDCPVEDWIKEPKLPVRWAKTRGTVAAMSTFDRITMRKSMFDAAAAQRFGRGTRQLARARAVVTDRLHVHIVSLLMGKPHAVLDNSYGKITRFMDAFPGGMDLTYRARSLQDGMQWARGQAARVEKEAMQ